MSQIQTTPREPGWQRLDPRLRKHPLVALRHRLVRATLPVLAGSATLWLIPGLTPVTVTATTAAGSGGYPVIDVTTAEGLAVAEQAVPGLLTPFLAWPREMRGDNAAHPLGSLA